MIFSNFNFKNKTLWAQCLNDIPVKNEIHRLKNLHMLYIYFHQHFAHEYTCPLTGNVYFLLSICDAQSISHLLLNPHTITMCVPVRQTALEYCLNTSFSPNMWHILGIVHTGLYNWFVTRLQYRLSYPSIDETGVINVDCYLILNKRDHSSLISNYRLIPSYKTRERRTTMFRSKSPCVHVIESGVTLKKMCTVLI